MTRSTDFYRGLALGAGLMFLFDPERGKTRRAQIRDKAGSALGGAREFLNDAAADLSDRTRGVAAGAAALFRPDVADEAALAERVRARLGRYVSHPRAVQVEASGRTVTLSGPILRGEAEALIGAVSSVRGVRDVQNRLEPHDTGEGVPALRGGRDRRPAGPFPISRSPGLQLVAGVLGATALAYGAGRIAARLRSARRKALERDMPEYAMLR